MPAVMLGLAVCQMLSAATLNANLDRETMNVGESATFSLIFFGGSPPRLPEMPAVPGLTFNYVGQSTQFSFINGRSSSTVTHKFLIRASKAGDYTIPEISVTVDGIALSTDPLTLKVLQRGDAVAGADPAGRPAFLRLIVAKPDVYLGEVVPVEIHLYARQGRLKQAPQLTQEGFTVGKMVQQQEARTMVNGQNYNLLVYKTYVSPAKTGQLALGPATLSMAIPHPQTRVSFFGEPLDWADLDLASESLTLNVLPLPSANVPPDFSGAVGNFTLSASASTNAVTVGDPITLTVHVAGRGVIESLALSCVEKWRDFKTYPPVTKVEISDPPLGLQGSKTFEQVVIPENSEIRELPPITFSFFDPDQRAYRTVSRPAMPIVVRPNNALQAQPTIVASPAQNPQEPRPASDIVHLKARPGVLAQLGPPLVQQPLFLALQGVPLLALLAALAWRRRREQLAANPRLRRQQRVAALTRSGIEDLRRQAAANQPEEFYATTVRVLQEQIGATLDLPASAITEAVIEDRLRPRGLASETLSALHEIFQTCNQARYAPQGSNEELVSLVPKVEAVLAALKELKD